MKSAQKRKRAQMLGLLALVCLLSHAPLSALAAESGCGRTAFAVGPSPDAFYPAVEQVYLGLIRHLANEPGLGRSDLDELDRVLFERAMGTHLSIEDLRRGYLEFVRNDPDRRGVTKARVIAWIEPMYRQQLARDLKWIFTGEDLRVSEKGEARLDIQDLKYARQMINELSMLYTFAVAGEPIFSAIGHPGDPKVSVWIQRFERMGYRFRSLENSLFRLGAMIDSYIQVATPPGEARRSLWLQFLDYRIKRSRRGA